MRLLSRPRKRLAAWLCLAAMLFAQAAYAAHACVSVDAAVDEMPCHEHGNPSDDGKLLCQSHCLSSEQMLDLAKIPVLAPQDVPVLVLPAAYTPRGLPIRPYAKVPAHPGAPPLAVLNCCFRI
jgi:hypothetical protein